MKFLAVSPGGMSNYRIACGNQQAVARDVGEVSMPPFAAALLPYCTDTGTVYRVALPNQRWREVLPTISPDHKGESEGYTWETD